MRNEKDFFALMNVKQTAKFGALQTINVTVNRAVMDKTDIYTDIERIAKLAGGGVKRYSVVGSEKPFPHGSIDMFFENEVLARYVYTQTPTEAFVDWRLYLTGAEVHLREGSGVIESKKAVPEAEIDKESVDDYETEIVSALSAVDIQTIKNVVKETF